MIIQTSEKHICFLDGSAVLGANEFTVLPSPE